MASPTFDMFRNPAGNRQQFDQLANLSRNLQWQQQASQTQAGRGAAAAKAPPMSAYSNTQTTQQRTTQAAPNMSMYAPQQSAPSMQMYAPQQSTPRTPQNYPWRDRMLDPQRDQAWMQGRLPSQGQAQPKQPQSSGDPYPVSREFQAQLDAAAASNRQRNEAMGYPANHSFARGAARPPSQEVTGDPRGAFATAAPQDRPAPFVMGPAMTAWGPSNDPFAEREALIQRLNADRMQHQQRMNQTVGGPMGQGWTPMPSWWANPFMNPYDSLTRAGLAGGSMSLDPTYGTRTTAQAGRPVGGWIGEMNRTYG